MSRKLLAAALVLSLWSAVGINSGAAADLVWEVENPFRLFKTGQAFALHEAAFKAVRGDANSQIPADIVWRLERRLNDPDCKDRSSPSACAKAESSARARRMPFETFGAMLKKAGARSRRIVPRTLSALLENPFRDKSRRNRIGDSR